MGHPSEDLLLAHYRGEAADAEIAGHVAECAECREHVASLDQLIQELRSPILWRQKRWLCNGISVPATQLSTAAERLLRASIDEVESAVQQHLVDNDLLDPRLIEKMIAAARARLTENPLEAFRLATCAGNLASRISSAAQDEVLFLRGSAEREKANALRLLGRYGEAHVALDAATDFFADLVISEPELAAVQHVRATIIFESGRTEEALELARHAAATFRTFGMQRKALNAQLLEGGILHWKGDFDGARRAFEAALASARALNDDRAIADALSNVGAVLLDQGDLENAGRHLRQSLDLSSAFDCSSERLRTEWLLARVAWGAGDLEEAARQLNRIQSEFSRLGVAIDAALIAMDEAEIHLALGDPHEARRLCADLISQFEKNELRSYTASVLDVLRRAVSSEEVTATHLSMIRTTLFNASRSTSDIQPN